jgi:hypothetical protein
MSMTINVVSRAVLAGTCLLVLAGCQTYGPTASAGPPPVMPDEQQDLESLPGGVGADDETPDAPPE